MKKILLTMIMAIHIFAAQVIAYHFYVTNNDKVIYIHNKYYENAYAYEYKHPSFEVYEVNGTLANVKNKTSRPSWKEDKRIPKQYRQNKKDYYKTSYDRGHNQPNASFDFSEEARDATFLMSNATPQARIMNRYLWYKIERLVRYLATKYKKVYVLNGSCQNVKVKNLYVPKYLYKVIYISQEKRLYSFLVPNSDYYKDKKLSTYKIKTFLTDLKEIEKTCGTKIKTY
jgi:endonuclease G